MEKKLEKTFVAIFFCTKKRTMGFFALAGIEVERAHSLEPRLSPGFKSQSQMSPSLLKVP